MKIIVVRHGETIEGKKGIILGQLPGTLSAKGKLEVKKIVEIIKNNKQYKAGDNLKAFCKKGFLLIPC